LGFGQRIFCRSAFCVSRDLPCCYAGRSLVREGSCYLQVPKANKDVTVTKPPGGNIIPKAFRVFGCAMENKFSMEATRPRSQSRLVDWDDNFVTDLQRGLIACRIFAVYPILWLCHIQVFNNLVSQAGQMETHGLPNDIFPNLNPIAVLVLLPIVQQWLYPTLRKAGIRFPPVNRMAVGFVIEAVAMAYCAGVQQIIYSRGPCYNHALECDASNGGEIPNRINVWIQAPVLIIDGLAEVFFDLASQEYAYNKAPDNMKSIVQAILSATSGVGVGLGFALYLVSRNPYLVYMYAALVATVFSTGVGL
jgi:POT family proton-dependent oligopeptide transporter